MDFISFPDDNMSSPSDEPVADTSSPDNAELKDLFDIIDKLDFKVRMEKHWDALATSKQEVHELISAIAKGRLIEDEVTICEKWSKTYGDIMGFSDWLNVTLDDISKAQHS